MNNLKWVFQDLKFAWQRAVRGYDDRDEFIGYVFEFETGNTNKKNIFTRSMKLYQKSKNKTQLNSFIEFCCRHPELRFWQALAAWSGYDYIYVSNSGKKDLKDTFYL